MRPDGTSHGLDQSLPFLRLAAPCHVKHALHPWCQVPTLRFFECGIVGPRWCDPPGVPNVIHFTEPSAWADALRKFGVCLVADSWSDSAVFLRPLSGTRHCPRLSMDIWQGRVIGELTGVLGTLQFVPVSPWSPLSLCVCPVPVPMFLTPGNAAGKSSEGVPQGNTINTCGVHWPAHAVVTESPRELLGQETRAGRCPEARSPRARLPRGWFWSTIHGWPRSLCVFPWRARQSCSVSPSLSL